MIIFKALSQLCSDRLHEFCFFISIYFELNPQISCTYLDIFLAIHVLFGLPLSLGRPSTCIAKLFLPSIVVGLRWIYPNRLERVSLNLSPIVATRYCSWKRSFLILSFLVLPHIHLNILIFAKSISCICCLLIGQHSARLVWSNRCLVKSSLQSRWHSAVTKVSTSTILLLSYVRHLHQSPHPIFILFDQLDVSKIQDPCYLGKNHKFRSKHGMKSQDGCRLDSKLNLKYFELFGEPNHS